MSKFKSTLMALWKEEDGLTTVEYAIAGGLVGAAVILAFTDLGEAVGGVIEYITDELTSNTPATP
jgi:pilus assembly protein Flp/PilA